MYDDWLIRIKTTSVEVPRAVNHILHVALYTGLSKHLDFRAAPIQRQKNPDSWTILSVYTIIIFITVISIFNGLFNILKWRLQAEV